MSSQVPQLVAEHDGAPSRLRDRDAVLHSRALTDDAIAAATADATERIAERQRLLYADGKHAVLVVLQGRDAGGKDGTIRTVFGGVNPQGCEVTSFKAPTDIERRHDFLWRVHAHTPALGMIGIFNRSHYEELLHERVRLELPKKEWSRRYRQINDFERLLVESGTVILKFLLHVSRDEQRKRLLDRLHDPKKGWKFNPGDLEDRERWDGFTKGYRGLLANTSTDRAPWYVVPADDKKVRSMLVARTVADTLDALDLQYPPLDPALADTEFE